MSVYIKGMEMPTDCALLLKIFPDGRVGVPVHLNWMGTMVVNDAEAVPVPPHGDLIDRDALIKDGWLNLHKKVMRMGGYAIHELPLKNPSIAVIIPAEEREQ